MPTRSELRGIGFGKDARTDAMISSCLGSATRSTFAAYSQFRIPSLVEKCKPFMVGLLTDLKAMVAFVQEVQPDLAIIGPEEPLGAGLVDALELLNVRSFGPHSSLARIETSKSWARELVRKHGIPGNPEYRIFRTSHDVKSYVRELGGFVVKPDGLTGGKGVRVSGEHLDTDLSAERYVDELLSAGEPSVVVEERLDGEEFTLQTITDGVTVVHCPLVQDHKRAYEGDTGPNTGGMGSYSCEDHSLPFLTADDVQMAQQINADVINALMAETGRSYKGVLYGGFISTSTGVKLIEYNARFGDPEAMNVLTTLDSDFLLICDLVSRGRLEEAEADVRFLKKATVCKYVVPNTYPEAKTQGERIAVRPEAGDIPGLSYFWAATEQTDAGVELTGSRAVAFVGVADTVAEAERIAEAGARLVDGPVRHRSDVGSSEAISSSVAHIQRLKDAHQA